MSFSAVILAGGQSKRMGRDKASLPFDGQPLLARQIEIIRELAPSEIFISGRAGSDYVSFGCPVLTDRFPDAGPLAGIERALAITASPLLLVLAVDMPHITAELLRRLAAGCAGEIGMIPRHQERIEPLAAYYPKTAWPLLVKLLDDRLSRSPLGDPGLGPLPVAGKPNMKSPSATRFAELCVQAGLARFQELSAEDARGFVSWNSPADWDDNP
jgi:molybdenum cofactor guanylyltransferase